MNNKEKIVKKLLFDIIDKLSKDADVYNHNGSLWLINTDSARWIFEFTKSKTLWYNYNFFRSALKFVSLDVNEGDNQKYITEWFESRYLNINQVKHTLEISNSNPPGVEDTIQNGVKNADSKLSPRVRRVDDTIQNGVKDTISSDGILNWDVEDTIQNGVKTTRLQKSSNLYRIEDTIQNGVKDTRHEYKPLEALVEDAVQNGVKHTEKSLQIDGSCVIEDVIKEGVKHTEYGDWEDGDERLDDIIKNGVKETNMEEHHRLREVVQTVKNGVKETCAQIPSIDAVVERVVEEGIKETHDDVYHHNGRVEGVIKNGIKEVQPLPAQDGNRDWGLYYNRKEDRTKPFTEYVKDVIENGNKIHDI